MAVRMVAVTDASGKRWKVPEIAGEVVTAEVVHGWKMLAARGEMIAEDLVAKVDEVEAGFASDVPVDTRSTLVHMDALALLAARGIKSPTAEEYADAVAEAGYAALGFAATTDPLPSVKQGAPLLVKDPDARVDAWVRREARRLHLELDENGVLPQSTYDELARRAPAELRRGAENIGDAGNRRLS